MLMLLPLLLLHSAIVVVFAFFAFNVFFFYSPLFSCNVNIVIEKLNEAKREPLNTQSIFRFDRGFFSALLYIRISESFIDIIYPPNMLQTLNLKRKLNQINRGVFTLNIAKLSEVNAVFFSEKKNRNRLM